MSELDHERSKAATIHPPSDDLPPDMIHQATLYARTAIDRGAEFATTRCLAEAVDVPGLRTDAFVNALHQVPRAARAHLWDLRAIAAIDRAVS